MLCECPSSTIQFIHVTVYLAKGIELYTVIGVGRTAFSYLHTCVPYTQYTPLLSGSLHTPVNCSLIRTTTHCSRRANLCINSVSMVNQMCIASPVLNPSTTHIISPIAPIDVPSLELSRVPLGGVEDYLVHVKMT